MPRFGECSALASMICYSSKLKWTSNLDPSACCRRLTMKIRLFANILVLCLLILPSAAQVSGSGTANFVPRWTNSTALGNSLLFQANGMVGIGTTTPAAKLALFGSGGTAGVNGGNAPSVFQVVGGRGGSNLSGFGVQGSGGSVQVSSGSGAPLPTIATGGSGATILMTGGSGANCIPASTRCGVYAGGNGGSIALLPGTGGAGTTVGKRGFVGVGTTAPSHTFEVVSGGSTLADQWTTRSSRRFKANIQVIEGALEKVKQLKGVSYERKDDGRRQIGVVAEDVALVVPEVVSLNPDTGEPDGVDYSRLAALLIEAIKSQQIEIRDLEARIRDLTAK
jgi:hypothetical protein